MILSSRGKDIEEAFPVPYQLIITLVHGLLLPVQHPFLLCIHIKAKPSPYHLVRTLGARRGALAGPEAYGRQDNGAGAKLCFQGTQTTLIDTALDAETVRLYEHRRLTRFRCNRMLGRGNAVPLASRTLSSTGGHLQGTLPT